ncbi:hypothetical protein A3J90_02885 [candidate division WOR-1 bacterium RIFOXYC2_FULL_37_10]|uniref:DUF5655 domain-containing protein n=1 Tax=candidate division WOR-1 bacterium RIFOXYB2_FULL_37_13 TaxID=1802579 RepID=A0A1F4SP93_UNCSA|nr:MAG: hypothetical protein A2246_00090 [candidate division WOR-1 bacterium RIFOXYA2_FULL_37_7]OGC22266.1 MAG: hypothetical protein A2310_01565 [candidate division WOR-1 bacterium RIFOXYB2_FULL_37_13]OGC34558.1 MAG: hypothetical protein A3J90_02885 [candidate division WOR-1 bacterium RIFOXYC2_FULL_37_10]
MFEHLLEKYLLEIKTLSSKFFPHSFLSVNYSRFNRVSIRIEISKKFFIDIYCNVENNRKNYALIKDDERKIGWDNLGGWHCHPFGKALKHKKCKEPSAKKIFSKIKEIVEETTK